MCFVIIINKCLLTFSSSAKVAWFNRGVFWFQQYSIFFRFWVVIHEVFDQRHGYIRWQKCITRSSFIWSLLFSVQGHSNRTHIIRSDFGVGLVDCWHLGFRTNAESRLVEFGVIKLTHLILRIIRSLRLSNSFIYWLYHLAQLLLVLYCHAFLLGNLGFSGLLKLLNLHHLIKRPFQILLLLRNMNHGSSALSVFSDLSLSFVCVFFPVDGIIVYFVLAYFTIPVLVSICIYHLRRYFWISKSGVVLLKSSLNFIVINIIFQDRQNAGMLQLLPCILVQKCCIFNFL